VRFESDDGDPLARSHGYVVLADDGWLGHVETPVFERDSSEVEYLVVRAPGGKGLARRALVSRSLVRRVDLEDRFVHVRGTTRELSRLPDSLPLSPNPHRQG
jgi:hypothetical protein